MDSEKCIICGFNFKVGTTVDGKCTECAKKFPDSNSMKEVLEKQNPHLKQNEKELKRKVFKLQSDLQSLQTRREDILKILSQEFKPSTIDC